MKVVGELLHKNMINNILSSHYEKIIVAVCGYIINGASHSKKY